MKRIMVAILMAAGTVIYSNSNVFGIHTILRNAGNITQGKLDPARVDPATFTLLGPTIEIGEILGGTSNFLQNAFGVAFSSHLNAGAGSIHASTTTLSTSTSTLQSRTNQIAIDTGTLQSRVNQIAIDTGTLALVGGNTNYQQAGVLFFASNTVRGVVGGVVEVGAGVIFATQVAAGQFATGSDDLGNHIATRTLEMRDQNIIGISSLTVMGSSISFSGSTSTGTIVFQSTAPAANGIWRVQNGVTFVGGDLDTTGGGGGGVATSTVASIFRVIVGTLGAQNVDIASNTVDGLNEAITRLGAVNTHGNTVRGTIGYKQGEYAMRNATVPAGITMYALPGSSVTWRVTSSSETMVTNYGTIDGINFNAGSGTISSLFVVLGTNSITRNFVLEGNAHGEGTMGGTVIKNEAYLTCFLCVVNSSNVLVENGEARNLDGNRQGFANAGDAGYFTVRRSTNVTFRNFNTRSLDRRGQQTSENSVFALFYSINTTIEYSNFDAMAYRFIIMSGHGSSKILHNTGTIGFSASAPQADSSIVGIRNDHNVTTSTGTVFAYNEFVIRQPRTHSVFGTGGAASGEIFGLVIRNNIVRARNAGEADSWTFANLSSEGTGNTGGTGIFDNNVFDVGTFLLSEGTTNGTLSASVGNTLNNEEQ